MCAALLDDPTRPAEHFYPLVSAVPSIADIVAAFGDAHAVEHLSRLWQVERVTGGEPETLRDFLRANHESLFAQTGYGDR